MCSNLLLYERECDLLPTLNRGNLALAVLVVGEEEGVGASSKMDLRISDLLKTKFDFRVFFRRSLVENRDL